MREKAAGAIAEQACRPGLLLWCLLSSTYAMLAYHPFTREHAQTGMLLPAWADGFLSAHAWLYAALFTAAAWRLFRVRGKRPRDPGFLFFSAAGAAFMTWLLLWPWSGLAERPAAFFPVFAAWLPLLLWEVLLLAARPPLRWEERPDPLDEGRMLWACAASALWVFMVFSVGAASAGTASFAAFACSLLLHLLLFSAVFAAWKTVRASVSLLGRGPLAESLLLLFGMFAGGTLVLKLHAVPYFPFSGASGWGLADWALTGWISAAFSLSLLGASSAAALSTGRKVPGALGFISGAAGIPPGSPAVLIPLGASALLVLLLCGPASRLDHGFLFRTLIALSYWFWTLLLACASAPPAPRVKPRAAVLGVLLASWAALGAAAALAPSLALSDRPLHRALNALSESDPSFRTARRLFAREQESGAVFDILDRHTNLLPSAPLSYREAGLAGDFGPSLADKPDIYIFLIDSLRRDYVGVYNPEADFTPNFDAFARENIAFENAFAAYGGTALSEHSLWAGMLLPHIQTIRPFAPFNNLERLIRHEGHIRWMSMDVFLKPMLTPQSGDAPLDKGAIGDYELCRTLTELEGRLEGAPKDPLFVFTRPEDVHVSAITRSGGPAPHRCTGEGFCPPYPERIRRMDACFGRFIAKLKAMGRYERSVMILTADHGESLGGGRRWGHSYGLAPEILRVPMIWRIPKRYLRSRQADRRSPAFVTDITPTLYDLLGHPPERTDALTGRSLLSPPGPAHEARLAASCYGPVYALITGNGRFLYVADALDRSTQRFDLVQDPHGRHDIATPAEKEIANRRLAGLLKDLGRRFGYVSP